jgi:hypothetical protein
VFILYTILLFYQQIRGFTLLIVADREKVLRIVMVIPESPKEAKAEILKASDGWADHSGRAV